ncbi:MAG: molybdenum ABC transporter permease subunit [Ignavibacteria bacterium RIFCSPHIGHO2_02_FULL_56_12]|nr:MAG: molybdenum ABC transporter permease subunit [Ignavibacteria bacterium RIFCSPHIGHO2_02_FULL_56_12]
MNSSPLTISLQTAFVSTAFSFVLGMLLARWRLTARAPWGSIVDGVMVLPVALPPTVVGLGLLILLGPASIVGEFVEILFTWPATVVASFVVSFPLMYLTTRAALEQVDKSLIDLARTYGYSEQRILWRVMLPLAWPGVATGLLFAFVRALGEFGATLMIAGNIPGKTQTLPLAIFFAVEAGELGEALFLAGLSSALAVLVVLALSRIRTSA